jgi:cobalt-zinc-cadmium efflux system outer membrane protein
MYFAQSSRSPSVHARHLAMALVVVSGAIVPKMLCGQSSQPVPLSDLVQEVQRNNPTIAASAHAWQASTHVPAQVTALPGTELMVQQFSVGSPTPFAGFGENNFAYIGVSASQELPYPGKRALRGEVARHEADSLQAESEAVRRQVVEAVALAYVQLAYLQQTLQVIEQNDRLLTQTEAMAESRYRAGQGNQQDVLKAQLQHTRILQEIATHRQDVGMVEAQLKQLLNRSQETPDIITEPLAPTPLPYSAAQLLQRTPDNPDVQARSDMVKREQAQVELARKEFKPDFTLQYMYQHTAAAFPDYYMGTIAIRLANRGRQRAVLAEAEQNQQRAHDDSQAELQRVSAEVQQQSVLIQGSTERLTIYREGLMPQAEATYQAGLAAYEANRQGFEPLLASLADVLNIEIAYWRELADHESAIARLERLTGTVRP